MAALLGGVPLMLGHGTGSELRQPLGYAMVGGLLVSQALTLFTTPVIYLYLDRLSNWLRRSGKHPEVEAAPTTRRRSAQARRASRGRGVAARRRDPPSERRALAHRGRERAVVEIVELAADRHAMGEAGDLDADRREQIGDVVGGGLAVDRGVDGEDHLLDAALARRAPTSPAMLRSSGPMPSSGDSVPPST